MERNPITIVSGLPRSGTSMMMGMLEAGGMAVLTDHVRTADEDNPRGYYEFERVKQIEHDQAWLPEAHGKVVKMIAALLKHLPPGYRYKIIFLQRHLEEVLASQRRMLVRRGSPRTRSPTSGWPISLDAIWTGSKPGWPSSPISRSCTWTMAQSWPIRRGRRSASSGSWVVTWMWRRWRPWSTRRCTASDGRCPCTVATST